MRDAVPSTPSSVVERSAERLADLLVGVDAWFVRRRRRLLGWWRVAVAAVGVGGLALCTVGAVPVPEVAAAAALLALMGSLAVDGAKPGARGHVGAGAEGRRGTWDR